MYSRINEIDRVRICTLKEEGHCWEYIEKTMKERYNVTMTKRGMQKLWKKYVSTGSFSDKKRTGRPASLTLRDKRLIRRISMSNRKLTAVDVTHVYNNQTKTNLACRTVQKILNGYGLKSKVAAKKPFLSLKQRMARVAWARDKEHWDESKWEKIVFSDESIFQSFPINKRIIVRRMSHEKYRPYCIQRTAKHGPQIHVWGCFSVHGVGVLKRLKEHVNADYYINHVVNDIDIMCQCLVFPKKDFIFQQDLAPAHRASATRNFFRSHNVNVLDWPGNSPDANPIENLWKWIKTKRTFITTTAEDMWQDVSKIWYSITHAQCKQLIGSMPRRVKAILKSNGYATKY